MLRNLAHHTNFSYCQGSGGHDVQEIVLEFQKFDVFAFFDPEEEILQSTGFNLDHFNEMQKLNSVEKVFSFLSNLHIPDLEKKVLFHSKLVQDSSNLNYSQFLESTEEIVSTTSIFQMNEYHKQAFISWLQNAEEFSVAKCYDVIGRALKDKDMFLDAYLEEINCCDLIEDDYLNCTTLIFSL